LDASSAAGAIWQKNNKLVIVRNIWQNVATTTLHNVREGILLPELEGSHLRAPKHYSGWTIIIIRSNTDLALTVGIVICTGNELVIHIQGNRVIVRYHCNYIWLVQTCMYTRIRTWSITLY